MRLASSRRLVRQRARGHVRIWGRLATIWQEWRRPARHARHAGWAAIVVTLLVSASALLGAGAPTTAGALSGHTARHETVAAHPASGAPAEYRWRDPANGTAILLTPTAGFTASIAAARLGGRIEFDLPKGDIVYLTPGPTLAQLEVALQSLSPDTTFDQSARDCVGGALVPAGGGPGVASGARSIIASLQMHVGQFAGDGMLVAYAGLSFSVAPDKSGCSQSTPLYQVLAGCDASSCTPPLPPATAVQRYDNAVVSAVQSHEWSSVYILTAASISTQYNLDQFTAAMNAQVSQQGRITAISPVSDAQIKRQTRDGLQFFSARQSVTLVDPRSNSTTRQITSYYLFEAGTWKFWFSA